MGWDAPDPDRLGRLSGLQPRRAPHAQRRRRRLSIASRRPRATAHAGVRGRHPGAARRRHRDDVRRVSELAGDAATTPTPRWRGRCAGHAAARDALLRARGRPRRGRRRGRRRARRSSASSRAGRTRTCATASVAGTVAVGFDAYAIGGLSVGEPIDDDVRRRRPHRRAAARRPAPLPDGDRDARRPRRGVARGIDLFDCVLPTRNARNGQLFTRARADHHQERPVRRRPAAAGSRSAAARPAGAIRGPISAPVHGRGDGAATLNTLHNLHFYLDTMRAIRKAIEFGTFETFRTDVPRDVFPPASSTLDDLISARALRRSAMAQPARQPRASGCRCCPFALMIAHLLLPGARCRCGSARRRSRSFSRALKVGDRVITTSGIYGQVTKLVDKAVQIADRRQGADRSRPRGRRRVSGPGAGRASRSSAGSAVAHEQEPSLEAPRHRRSSRRWRSGRSRRRARRSSWGSTSRAASTRPARPDRRCAAARDRDGGRAAAARR